MVWQNYQNFMTLQNALYLHSTPKGENEDLLLFVVLESTSSHCSEWVSSRCQTTKAITIPCPYYKNAFGGQDGQPGETIY